MKLASIKRENFSTKNIIQNKITIYNTKFDQNFDMKKQIKSNSYNKSIIKTQKKEKKKRAELL